MPTYTFAEIKTQAAANVGRRTDIDADVLTFKANEAYHEVLEATEHALQETSAEITLVAGTSAYDLPTDFVQPLHFIVDGAEEPLEPTTALDVDSRATEEGEPTRYAFFGDQIELSPTPTEAGTLKVRYLKKVDDMAADADEPIVASRFRPAIIMKLEEKLHYYLGNYAAAALAEQRYLSFLSKTQSDQAKRQRDHSRTGVRVVY